MKTVSRTGAFGWAIGGSLLLTGGCGQVLGLDEFTDQVGTSGQGGETGATTTATGGGSTATGGGATATTTGTGGGATATTGTGGSGGMGAGTGGSGGSFCVPGATDPCYTGPAGTEDVGMCTGGTHVCNDQGTAYLPGCTGEVLPAVSDDCDAIGDEDCDGVACSEPIWAKSFATGGAPSVGVDTLGNTYVYGVFPSSIKFGATTLITAGSDDLYLAKLDITGTPVWAKQFGDSAKQYSGKIAVGANGELAIFTPLNGSADFGGVNLVSAGNYDVAVAMFDTNGSHLWSKRFGDSNTQYPQGIAVDPQGDVILLGNFTGTIDLGGGALSSSGSNDIFLAKLNGATGAQVWAKRFGDASAQNAAAVGVDSAGNIAITGTYSGTLNLGQQNLVSGSTDIYLGRFDAAGNHACSQSITSTGGGTVDALAIGSTGNILLSGSYSGTIGLGGANTTSAGQSDLFLTSRAATCGYQWSQTWGGTANDFRSTVAVDDNDEIVFGAQTTGALSFGGALLTSVGTYDVVLAKFNAQGVHLWSRIFGDGGVQDSPAVTTNGQEIVFACNSSGSIDFGQGVLGAGLAVARFAP